MELSRHLCLPLSDLPLRAGVWGPKTNRNLDVGVWPSHRPLLPAMWVCHPINCHINIVNQRTPSTPTHQETRVPDGSSTHSRLSLRGSGTTAPLTPLFDTVKLLVFPPGFQPLPGFQSRWLTFPFSLALPSPEKDKRDSSQPLLID